MDFDAVLEKCGNYGRYQFLLLLLYGYVCILSSMHYFTQTIISFTPEHWCHHDSLENLSLSEIRQIYAGMSQPSCTPIKGIVNNSAVIAENEKCQRWIFDYDRNYQSVTTELDWVCDDAFQVAIGQSLFYVGSVLGTIFFGILADRVGRLPALVLTTLSGASGDFLTSFVYSLPAFAVGRFIAGLSTDTLFYLVYIMVFEYLDPKKRTFGLNVIPSFFYGFGLMLTPWFAVWLGTWRKYLLVASIPATAVLLFPVLICESAQWLLTKKKYEGAVKCLKQVAKWNKRVVDESVFKEFISYYEEKWATEEKLSEKKETFIGMFKTPRLRKFTIILILKSMIITISFDIISRNVEGLGSSPFVLFSLTSIVYIPAGFTIILLQNRIGRKGMAFGSLLIGGIITAITGFMIAVLDRERNALLLAFMVGLGRYGANIAYDAEAQYATEIIPTSVRGRGMANIHVIGYAFSFLSAYTIYLGNYYKPLPSIFISILMLLGSVLCLLLPETLNRKLPENLSDGEKFGRGQKWWYFPCFGRDKKQQPEEK